MLSQVPFFYPNVLWVQASLHPKFKARVRAGEEPNAPLQPNFFLYMWQLGILVLAISVGLFWRKNSFCVFWPFLVFLGVIFTQPRCFRVFLALHMTSTHPRHLPDTLRHHPDTARHPQTPSRHPSDTPIFGLHAATGRKSNIWLSWYLFNWFQFLRHPHTPDICLTHSDTIQTLPDTLRHHPDTLETLNLL